MQFMTARNLHSSSLSLVLDNFIFGIEFCLCHYFLIEKVIEHSSFYNYNFIYKLMWCLDIHFLIKWLDNININVEKKKKKELTRPIEIKIKSKEMMKHIFCHFYGVCCFALLYACEAVPFFSITKSYVKFQLFLSSYLLLLHFNLEDTPYHCTRFFYLLKPIFIG